MISQQESGISLANSECKISIFKSLNKVPSDWETAQPADNVYLQKDYLQVVEYNCPKEIALRYVIFYKNDFPVGVGLFQLYRYSTVETIKELREPSKKFNPWLWIKRTLAKPLNFNLLICGNNLLTGEHGYHFNENYVGKDECIEILNESMRVVGVCLANDGKKPHGYFIKDICEWRDSGRDFLVNKKYHSFTFNPNMFMPIREGWETFDDYLAAMSSKYRVRTKKAFKKAKSLEVRELNEAQIESYQDQIFALFSNIADKVAFNMVIIKPDYFLELKRNLGDRFHLFAYFDPAKEGEMVGFHTEVEMGKDTDAHFLGIDHSYNRSHNLYLFVLLNIVKNSIERKAKHIVFSRTAMEIKSTVGAEPENLYGYIRACSGPLNWIVGKAVKFFEPEADWVQRRPFKE